jgi:hypothetical protein
MKAKSSQSYFAAFGFEAPRSILALEPLTPGDFALAQGRGARRARLARWLVEELAAKPEGKRARMGFCGLTLPFACLMHFCGVLHALARVQRRRDDYWLQPH